MLKPASKTLLALLFAAASAAAQATDPQPPVASAAEPATTPAEGADARSVVLSAGHEAPAPVRPPDSDGSNRSFSPGIAAALSEGMPKFSPPTPTPTPDEDTDKPKNDIPRLPSYVVHSQRPVVFRDRDLYTSDALVSLSYKYHPGLRLGNLFGLNDPLATQMYRDDERLSNISDLTDTAHAMARGGDTAESAYILQATQDTYMRPAEDWSWNGPGGGGNSGGGGK